MTHVDNEPPDRAHWSRFADEWIAWAGTPGHDVFWAYRDALKAFIGQGSGPALDVGCGEGRVSRLLKSLGYHVTASDTVAAMLDAASNARSADEYVLADAAALPFKDAQFDLVIAYNMLMDVENVPAVVAEIRRVMHPRARLVISIVHPFRDRGRFADSSPEAPFVMNGSYFGRERFEDMIERDGLTMHFGGWSQPLQDYAAALERAGLAVTAMREPVPDGGDPQDHRLPLFLWLKAAPLPD
jgi:SAM-dependent methyltransferase